MPLTMPLPRYFSMPSTDVGAEGLQKPRFKLLAVEAVVDPFAGGGDPFAGRNRRRVADDGYQIARPRAFARRTQKPFSVLWKVTRSTRPARTSCAGDCR